MTSLSGNTAADPVTAVDLFAGPGGLGLGLRLAGFHVPVAVEKVQSCVETYKLNHPGTMVIHKDIRFVSDDEIITAVSNQLGKETVDLVAGGPPCETFSTAGPGIRNTRDHRDHLFRDMIRIAKALKAKYVLMENIPGLKTKKCDNGTKSGIFNDVINTLVAAGFSHYDWRVLQAADFGVPQFRQRLFILAAADNKLPLSFPEPTHGPGHTLKYVTVEEALGDLPLLDNNETQDAYCYDPISDYQKMMRGWTAEIYTGNTSTSQLTLHKAPNHRPGTIKRFKMILPGEGLKDIMTKIDTETLARLQRERILPKKWYIQRDRRLLLNRPSPTVTSHCLDELLHPIQDRHLSPRECARLQSYPDWYYFAGPWVVPHISQEQDKYEQIGDAIPPLLAKSVAAEIAGALKSENGGTNGYKPKSRQLDFRTLFQS